MINTEIRFDTLQFTDSHKTCTELLQEAAYPCETVFETMNRILDRGLAKYNIDRATLHPHEYAYICIELLQQ